MNVTEKQKRYVERVIASAEPIGHEQLAESVGLDWDELQSVIRALRFEGRVVIRIDRRYEVL